MKANPLQKLVSMMLVKSLMSQDNLFVPMPVKSKKHLLELQEQAGDIMLEIAKEEGEDTTAMEAHIAKTKADNAASKDDDQDSPQPTKDMKEASFVSLTPEQLHGALSDIRDKIIEVSNGADSDVKEVRGLAKLGFNDGVGMFVMLTNSQAVYDTADEAEFPVLSKCDNPNCLACHGEEDSNDTIH